MKLKELLDSIESTKGKTLPTAKALRNGSSPLVASKEFEDGYLNVYENGFALYYYQSDGKAEVNFVVQNRMGKIIPLEITTKSNSKAKSLSVFMKKFTVPQAYRITENNFSTKKDIRYIPVYAAFCIDNNNF